MLKSPPSALRPAAAVLTAVAILVGVLAGWGGTEAGATAGVQQASAATGKKVASAACRKYKRVRRQLKRAQRSYRARSARTSSRTQRLRLRRAHHARKVRKIKRMRRLRRACVQARRAPAVRRFRPSPSPAPDVNAQTDGVRWGLHANRWGRGPDGPGQLNHMQAMGVSWLREEFDSHPDQSSDALYLNAARRGMRILPLLQESSLLPSDLPRYKSVVSAFAQRYGPGGEFWTAHPEVDGALASSHIEIYNEPYGDWYGPVEPARYAALLREVVPAARAANPQVKFLMAVDWTPSGARHTWIEDLYRAEPALNQFFDGVAMHPFSGNRAPDEPEDPWGFVRIADARRVLQAHGAAGKSFWITEVGWSSCPGDKEWCVTEAEQAAYMERLAHLVRTRYTFVDAVFYYHFVGFERDPADSEDFYGILHADFSPKPAFHALRRITGAH